MKKFLAVFGICLIAVVSLVIYSSRNNDNAPKSGSLSRVQAPTSCSTQGQSATSLSTTSVAYMTAGTATTTATCNMQAAGNGTEIFDTASLQIMFLGSSTGAVLNVDIQDSTNGVDWYSRSLAWTVDGNTATSSPAIGTIQTFSFPFSSTTQDKISVTNANSTVAKRIVDVTTKTTFIRAIFTIPAGSTNGAVWANFVGKTQNP